MTTFQITNIPVSWDKTPSRQPSEASAVSVFRVQYVLTGLLKQALKSYFGLRMSWKRSQESLYLSIRHHDLEESSFHQNLNSLITFLMSIYLLRFPVSYLNRIVLPVIPVNILSSLSSHIHCENCACVFLSVFGILLTMP